MPYRTESCDVALMDAHNELLAVAASGRRRASRQLERVQLRRERAAKRERRAAERRRIKEQRVANRNARRAQQQAVNRMARSTTRLGLLARPGWIGWWYGVVAVVVPFLLLIVKGVPWAVWSALALLVLPALTLLVVYPLVSRGLRRERRWHADLPFRVEGYLELLAAPQNSKLAVGITFDRHPPETELVRDLLSAHELLGLDGLGRLRRKGRQIIFPIPENGGQIFAHDNLGYHDWIHRLVRATRQLHRVYPVRGISFGYHGTS